MRSLFSTTDRTVCFVVVVVVFKVVRVKKVVFEDGEEWRPTSTRDGVSPSRGRRRRRVSSASSGDWNSQMRNAEDERVGVLLLNLGGPETVDDVEPFLFNLFADPDIIRLPSASSSPSSLFKALFFLSPLCSSRSHSRTRDSLVRDEEKGSRRFVSLLCSCRCRGQRGQQQRQSFFGRDARDAKSGVSLLSFSLKCFSTDPSYVFSHRRCDCERTNRTKQTACNSYNSSSRRW